MKKLFSTIMCIMMIACFMPTMAFADVETANSETGTTTEPTQASIKAATLHDTAADGISDEDLAKGYSLTLAGDTMTINVQPQYHQNGDTPASVGKWIGFFLPIPKDNKDSLTYQFSSMKNSVTIESDKVTADYTDAAGSYVSFYWNYAANDMKWFQYKFGESEFVKLNIVVNATPAEVVAALPHDQAAKDPIADKDLYESYSVAYANGTATITTKGLKLHYNANQALGKWVGVAVPVEKINGKNAEYLTYQIGDGEMKSVKIAAGEIWQKEGKDYLSFYFDSAKQKEVEIKYAFASTSDVATGLNAFKVIVKDEGASSTGGGSYLPTLPTTPTAPTTPTTPEQKPATAATKTEANTAITTAAAANKYDKAEQAEVDQIVKDAEAKVKEAKTEDEVNAIKKDAEAKLDKILTTEEKVTIASLGEVSKRDFGAKSKKITKKNGKKAVTLSWAAPEGVDVDGYEIFRSTKKNSGYGTEPYFETTKTSYTNSKGLKSGKTYYYKVRAFVEINGERHYTDYSTKASRKI